MVDKENIESISGLAAMQKGMLFSHVVDSGSDAYVEQFDFTVAGEVDVDRMRAALDGVSRTYGVLRTVFSFRKTDEPYQIVLKDRAPDLSLVDYRDREDPVGELAAFKDADRARGFQLDRDVLLRAALVRVADRRWHLVLTFHHIVLDGWSLGPLFGTLVGYYEELAATGSCSLKTESLPYRDYIAWYERQRGEDARQHWADALEGYEREAVLPADPRPGGHLGAEHRFTLPAELHEGLKGFARQAQVTQNAVFQAAWGLVLQRFNHTDDVVFGSVVSGRGTGLDGIGEAVGLYANTQPVRVRTGPEQDFAALCREVQESYLRATAFEHYALHEIQGATPLKGKLLNHVLAFENYPLSEQLRDFGGGGEDGGAAEAGEGLTFLGVDVFERTSYDLHVVVNPGQDFSVAFVYNANHYPAELMRVLEHCLLAVFRAAAEDPSVRADGIAVWAAQPETAPAGTPSATAREIPLDSSVVDVFADVVAARGGETALVWRDREYTYRELDRWSDAVAWELRERGAEPGAAVGVLADRRPELVAAMLGLLKNGNYYVPVDTKDADPRVEYVLADAGARHLCTVADFAAKAPSAVDTLLVAEPGDREVPAFPRESGLNRAPAYLMYTSGSTGAPKGCEITHRNILRLVSGQSFFDFGPDQVLLFTGSPAFDASTFEVWGTLLSGGRLVLAEDLDVLDGERLRAALTRHGVRAMWLTSPLFNQLCAYDPALFAPLEHLLVGGSALSAPHLAKLRAACPDLRITNGYGPTENTTFSTTHEVRPEDLLRERVPIGRPLAHSSAHVLDRALNPLPPGAVGELCVGGEGVSTGYRNRPDLDAAAFVTAPALPGERLYRTGDLVRVLPDGTLDYLGRADDQVKISGFRVETGEVESLVKAVDGVEDAVVVCVESDGEKSLRGFYVSAAALAPETVRRALSAAAAAYMVPAVLTQVDKVPLTKNGKVDRARLLLITPEPEAPGAVPEQRHATPTQRLVYEAVADLVPGGAVDVHSNFFDLGINSLNLLTITNRLRKSLDRDLPVVQLFEHTSIAALAAYLDGGPDERAAEAEDQQDDEEQEQAMAASRLFLDMDDDEREGEN